MPTAVKSKFTLLGEGFKNHRHDPKLNLTFFERQMLEYYFFLEGMPRQESPHLEAIDRFADKLANRFRQRHLNDKRSDRQLFEICRASLISGKKKLACFEQKKLGSGPI